MSLYELYMKPCVLLVPDRETRDASGGYVTTWTDGTQFEAAVVLINPSTIRRAENDSLARQYSVTTHHNITLHFHDVFRRLEDGAVFRVTSDNSDQRTPSVASFEMAVCTAQRWELPE